VQAFDLGSPRLSSANFAVVTVHVTVANERFLIFSQSHFNISLNLPAVEGVIVSSELSATFHETRRSIVPFYSLSDGNSNSAFKVNPQNGNLLVADHTLLYSGNQYNLVIRADGGNHFSTAGITVTVLNIPDTNSLSFTEDTYEARIVENTFEVDLFYFKF